MPKHDLKLNSLKRHPISKIFAGDDDDDLESLKDSIKEIG